MTHCPKFEKAVPVSTTIKPVTQTAEVDVNRATNGSFQPPEALEIGSISRQVPNRIAPKNPRQIVLAIVIVFWVSDSAAIYFLTSVR